MENEILFRQFDPISSQQPFYCESCNYCVWKHDINDMGMWHCQLIGKVPAASPAKTLGRLLLESGYSCSAIKHRALIFRSFPKITSDEEKP
jgi:hypothetical protein